MALEKEYASKPADYYEHARIEILPLLPANIGVIADIGGSSGATLSAVKQNRPSITTTICVDAHAPSLEVARQRGHQTLICDLNGEAPDIVATCDVVMFLDVLEHLVDPWSVLQRIVAKMKSGATVIVSVPNVRFWEVSLGLTLMGRWTLQEAGVLDRTHLRFFTGKTGAQLIRGAGLRLEKGQGLVVRALRYRLANALTLGLFRDFLCMQYLYIGRKP
jgi:2-polyprenyl-3-methyl-5-hydroxy-6-metoxy-1,4-benzoquinol methylase